MVTLTIVTRGENRFNVTSLVEHQAQLLKFQGVHIEICTFESLQTSRIYSPLILDISNISDYEQSLSLIIKTLYPSGIPFIFLSSIKIDTELVSTYFPEHLLTYPYNESTLVEAIHLFLKKIQHGYFRSIQSNPTTKRLWLCLRRGVYISLLANEIKYVEAEDHYIKIYSDKQSLPLIKTSLRDFYQTHLMGFGHFFVLSRSYIININKVSKIENNQLFIDPNKSLPIPKGKRREILNFVGI